MTALRPGHARPGTGCARVTGATRMKENAMSVETRVTGNGSGTVSGAGRVGARVAMVGAVAGAALLPVGAAEANVVGVGNAAFGNTCVKQGGTAAAGSTVAGSGAASGNQASLPLSLPRNHCGNSGIICTALFRAAV